MTYLAYDRLGHGPNRVMVLHGWFSDQTMLMPMRGALDENAFTYICPSYRGYGGSRGLTGAYDMAEISSDVLALADHLGWSRFSLIGHSMGGMAVQRILADAPERVEKIIALNAVPAAGVPMDENSEALFTGAVTNPDNRYGIIDFTTGNRLPKSWIRASVDYSFKTAREDAFAAYLKAWTKTDFHTAIIGNTVPMKVIIGAHDPALNEEVMRSSFLQWYPHATLEIMPNAGHYPINETPLALAASIEAFLQQKS